MNTYLYRQCCENALVGYRQRLASAVPSRTWMFRTTYPTYSPHDPYRPR